MTCFCCKREVDAPIEYYGNDMCDWCSAHVPIGILAVAAENEERYEETLSGPNGCGAMWDFKTYLEHPCFDEIRSLIPRCGKKVNHTSSGKYPHVCPHCGKPAYIGLVSVDCSGGCK